MKDNCKLKWEEIFASEDSHKEFISKTKIPIQLNIKNTTTQDTKAQNTEEHISWRKTQIVIRHMKTRSALRILQFRSVAQLCPTFVTPWIAARQASLSITNSQSSLRFTSIKSVIPSSHLILCHPLLLLPAILPSIRVFSSESALRMRWPKYWSFSFSISPSSEFSELISFRWTGWISLLSKGLSRIFSNATVQKHQFFGTQLSSQSNSHIHTWLLEKLYL